MEKYYFLSPSQQPVGPMPFAAIKELHAAGMIQDESMIAAEGAANWQPYRDVTSLEPPHMCVPPVPNASATAHSVHKPIVRRNPFSTNILQLATLGIYSFYLVGTFAEAISGLTGRERLSLGMVLALSFITLGLFPIIYLVILAFDIDRYSSTSQTKGRRKDLAVTVLTLTVISGIGVFATAGIAIIAAIAAGVWSVWLVQAELNLYANRTE